MGMLEYIRTIKRKMRDQYHMEVIGGTEDDPLVKAPDGVYPMEIDGRLDKVEIKNDRIFCCRFEGESAA